MSIFFPNEDDITLEASPLSEVICQVRFAPILRIAGNLPIDYQELLRRRFPNLVKKDPFRGNVKVVSTLPIAHPPSEFICETADGLSSASLGMDFVALSTRKYLHWESFSSDLGIVLKAFQEVYGTILATRIGLRYINDLRFLNTGTESLNDLVDFLNPDLTHFYHNPIWNKPDKIASFILLRDENSFLALRIGIDSTPEESLFLDYDYYTEFETPTEKSADALLDAVCHYHRVIYNAFRWSIRKEKIDIFRPIG